MSAINKVIIGGNLVRDPEVKYTPKGTAICEATIANNESWTSESGERKERVTYVGLVIWGRRARPLRSTTRRGRRCWPMAVSPKKSGKTRRLARSARRPRCALTNGSSSAPSPPPGRSHQHRYLARLHRRHRRRPIWMDRHQRKTTFRFDFCGMAWHGKARHGPARTTAGSGTAWRGGEWQGLARRGVRRVIRTPVIV